MQTIIEPPKNNDILASAPVTINIPFEILLATIEALPDPQKWQIYQTLSAKFSPHSAEAKAISRLPDQDDSSKWITSIEEDELVDEQALNAWLEKKGYQKANV
ncbi:hypothetical protein [Pseudanabaena sp. ABRG5-3]|uniref:hypothetical protein n=1 Tax=Pseudanabaena sp. ABRG5-3 TaxID=685565 RepID=UPI000DC6FCBE|nr:hypothetical protein [Pseudanabaena sp. ABRG5-3]BBC27183.1 hypothetical protein ABRG53_f010 [Pseudanabaena sp. ABRG5-3]